MFGLPVIIEIAGWLAAGIVGTVCADHICDRLNEESEDERCSANVSDDDIIIDGEEIVDDDDED